MAAPSPVTIYEDRDTDNASQDSGRGFLSQKRVVSRTAWAVQSTATGRFVLSTATSEPAGVLLPVVGTGGGRFVLTTASSEVRNREIQDLGNGRFTVDDGARTISTVSGVWGISTRASEADGRFVQTTATATPEVVGIATGSATSGKIALVEGRRVMITVLPNATST